MSKQNKFYKNMCCKKNGIFIILIYILQYETLIENNPKILKEILKLSTNSKEKIENLQNEKTIILQKTEQHLNSNNLDSTLEILKKNKKEYQKLVIVQSYIQNLLDIDNLRYNISTNLNYKIKFL